MKKIFSMLGWAILVCSVNAQTTPPASENLTLDQQLSNINQSTVSSGIIYERVVPIANLYNYNKTSTFNTANFRYFKQAFKEMREASNHTKFISLEHLKNYVSVTAPNVVDLGVLNTQFHILNYNEDNPSAGGLTYNTTTNKFAAIRGTVPFYMLHNTVIAPLNDRAVGTSITYKIHNNMYFKNGTKVIKTLVANFGDGINRTLINNQVLNNQSITINYNSSGEKRSTFTLTFTDNTTLTTYGKIYLHYRNPLQPEVPGGACASIDDPLREDFELLADTAFTGYEPGDVPLKAKIQYRIYYGNPQKLIKKPIIILDGFDPGDKRKIEDCDCINEDKCKERNSDENGNFVADNHKSMTDMMLFYDGIEKSYLLPTLRSNGYDVIMVNHVTQTVVHPTQPTKQVFNPFTGWVTVANEITIDGGADYIERNAMAYVKLIQRVNTALVANNSTNQIAIVGPSMGGQISRYALAYMEKHNMPHNTYLWVSVDSPHLGANIPLGDQSFLNLVQGSSDAAKDFYEKDLSSPAAMQQLIEYHRQNGQNHNTVMPGLLNGQTVSQGYPQNSGTGHFQIHYNNQNSNGIAGSGGYPMNLRKIALVNGSLTGSKETQYINGAPMLPFANDSEFILNLRGFQRIHIDLPWPLGSITYRIHIASLEAKNMPTYNSGSHRIARFKKMSTDRTTQSSNFNIRGVMDNVPGGYFDAQKEIAEPTLGQDPVPGIYLHPKNWSFANFSLENLFI